MVYTHCEDTGQHDHDVSVSPQSGAVDASGVVLGLFGAHVGLVLWPTFVWLSRYTLQSLKEGTAVHHRGRLR